MASLLFTEGQDHAPSAISNAEQLLPNVIDGMATSRPAALYAQIPNSFTSYCAGYRKVTYRDLAAAINRVAWLLLEQLGPCKEMETLAYVGPNDISYIAIILGASKTGYTILSPSPLLPGPACADLLCMARCTTVLTLPPPYAPAVGNLIDSAPAGLRVIHIPTIHQLLDSPSRHFAFPFTYEAIKSQPLVIVHSSGTTGTPKLITYTHESAASFARSFRDPPPPGYYHFLSTIQSNRVLVTFPFFHAGALFPTLFDGIASQTTFVTLLGGVPPSTEGIIEAMRLTDPDALLLVAPFVEQIAKKKEWFEFVTQRVNVIGFGGADISQAAGNAFATAGVRIGSCYGLSETMTIPSIRPLQDEQTEDWPFIEPHACVNAVFEPHGDLHEMVLIKNTDPRRQQPVFTVFPHLDRFHTRDLFSPHPKNEKLWRFQGRSDDMILAASGGLCNPTNFEQEIAALPEVENALMVGTGRWRKALLIELVDKQMSFVQQQEVVDKIWPAIQSANRRLPKDCHVAKDHILCTEPGKPMQRAGKGTVQRASTLKQYHDRFEDLYVRHEDGTSEAIEPVLMHLSMAPTNGST